MNLLTIILLSYVSYSQNQPILQDIANWISGVKYVPPPSDNIEKASSDQKEKLFQPVNFNKYSSTSKPILEKDNELNAVVFNRSGGWLQPAGSNYLYLMGTEAASFYEAKYWCTEQGGNLAEIYSSDQMNLVKTILARDGDTNFWLGLEKSSSSWLTSGRSMRYQNWVEGEPNNIYSERCVVLQAKKMFHWAGWNCGYQKDGKTLFKALCQKENILSVSTSSPVETEVVDAKLREDDSKCSVFGVSLTGEDWLSRHSNVTTAGQCHQDCLDTTFCRFWTWRSDSKLCYLKTDDGPVVKDVLAVSGTTSARQGCRRSILDTSSSSQVTKVEYCSCKTESHDLVSGYIDPRSLPSSSAVEDPSKLGRLIRHNACPHGQVLSCTDDPQDVVETVRTNITDCLMYDVRLTVGGHVGVERYVPTAQTCHNYCLARPGCVYWTWRGETTERKCFMLPRETRLVRRQGSASGTVARDRRCDHVLEREIPETREEPDTCDCQLDTEYDLVGSGLIDPRILPGGASNNKDDIPDYDTTIPEVSGRIVNTHTDKCPPGYKKVCYEPKTNIIKNQDQGPKLFTSSLGLPELGEGWSRQRDVPRRDTQTDSAVSFPQ